MILLEEQYISMSDLQRNAKKCIDDIDNYSTKIIMSNNKPKAVLLSLNEYNYFIEMSKKIKEIEPDNFEKEAIKNIDVKINNGALNGIEADDDYFNNLK